MAGDLQVDPIMHPPLGQWNILYHKAISVLRHGRAVPSEFIDELIDVGVPLHFRHLLLFNVLSIYSFHSPLMIT